MITKNDLLEIVSELGNNEWLYQTGEEFCLDSVILKLKRRQLRIYFDINCENNIYISVEFYHNGDYENTSKDINIYKIKQDDDVDSVTLELKKVITNKLLNNIKNKFINKEDITGCEHIEELSKVIKKEDIAYVSKYNWGVKSLPGLNVSLKKGDIIYYTKNGYVINKT